MKERAISFGKSATLLGVLAEPSKRETEPQRPAVVMLNSGILHRVGACRTYVRIARKLAASGMTVLRFDFSGIGDSPARRDSLAFEESSILEVQEAMDYLQRRRGFNQFILIGLCSGADVGFEVSVVDPRVVGLAQIDAYAYRTPKHYWVHYGPKLLNLSIWTHWIRRKLGLVKKEPELSPTEEQQMPEYVRIFPPKEVVQEKLQKLVDRGVQQFYLYTGGQEEYNYRKQFEDAHKNINFGQTLEVDFLPQADHIITGIEDQKIVIQALDQWCQSRWPAETKTDAAAKPLSSAPAVPV